MNKSNKIEQVVIWKLISELPEEEQAKVEKYLKETYPDHFQLTVFLVPAKFKDRLPAIVKLLHELVHGYKKAFNSNQKQFDVVNSVHRIVGALERLFHSISYAENEFYEFDINPLIDDLEFAINILNQFKEQRRDKMEIALNDDEKIIGIEIYDKEIIENIIGVVSMETNKDLTHKEISAKWNAKSNGIKLKIELKE